MEFDNTLQLWVLETPSEMCLTKGHLDSMHSRKLIGKDDYKAINNLLGDIGKAFKKCKSGTII